jgi:Icc-related predicted phosphoesterase
MKIQIFSDLHVDVVHCPVPAPAPGIDAVLVAGDTCQGVVAAFETLRQIIPMQVPVIMVAGNHEFYRHCLIEEIAQARSQAPHYGIHFLENEAVVLGSIRFVGCTLWTKYDFYGEERRALAMTAAFSGMNDHRRIAWTKQPTWQRFRPREALMLHRRSRAFIAAELAKPFSGATVVVTHHAPHPRSIHSRYCSDILSAAYVSDLTALIETGRPNLWVHGHVHESFDYQIGATRVICNPHGYGNENAAFDPTLVVEVG